MSEQIPRHLWWVLLGITLVWGFNWTAMKVAISEVAPFTFRPRREFHTEELDRRSCVR
jgi:hypothetical protein